MYQVVRSDRPEAKQFRWWLTHRLSIHPLTPPPAREVSLSWSAGRTESLLVVRAREIVIDVARDLAVQM